MSHPDTLQPAGLSHEAPRLRTPPPRASQPANPDRVRNESTVKVSKIANGYLVNEVGKEVYTYKSLGELDPGEGIEPANVSEHLARFFANKE